MLNGETVSFNGTLRMDFLTAWDMYANPTMAGVQFKLTLSNFSASVGSISYGPTTIAALFEIDGMGNVTMTIGGMSIVGMDRVFITDADNYTFGTITIRKTYWGSASTYVDVTFNTWAVVAGRPTVGSSFTVSAGANSVWVQVTSSSTSVVTYSVQTTINGVSAGYTVTATYPAGGGAPSYTVAPT